MNAEKTVTALREVRGGVGVELDGARWRVLPVGAVVSAGLTLGGHLDRETARRLARELRRLRALAQATRLLAASDRSRGTLDERLERAGHSAAARAEALEALERAGLIDDERVAQTRAATLAGRGYGDTAIRVDLLRRRVPAETAAAAVAALEPERERARQIVEGQEPSPRLVRRLAARGFSRDTVESVVEQVFAEEA